MSIEKIFVLILDIVVGLLGLVFQWRVAQISIPQQKRVPQVSLLRPGIAISMTKMKNRLKGEIPTAKFNWTRRTVLR